MYFSFYFPSNPQPEYEMYEQTFHNKSVPESWEGRWYKQVVRIRECRSKITMSPEMLLLRAILSKPRGDMENRGVALQKPLLSNKMIFFAKQSLHRDVCLKDIAHMGVPRKCGNEYGSSKSARNIVHFWALLLQIGNHIPDGAL